jgi:hypothetical protein
VSPDHAAGKHCQQLLIVLRGFRFRLVAEIGRNQLTDRRPVLPSAVKVFEKKYVDLVEDFLAGPAEFDDEVGDELAPVYCAEALVA